MAKILYVITKSSWGGATRYVYDLAVGAKAAGHEVAVSYGGEGELGQRLREADIRAIPIAALARDISLLREVRSFFELITVLRQERPDVVHVNSSKAGGLGCLASRFVGVPHIIFTAHGWAFNETRPWWQKAIIYKLVWLTILLSHKTICVSNAVRDDVRWMPLVSNKLVVIHNGVSIDSMLPREEARRALRLHSVARYWIGMISELHPTKRISDAISAFSSLADRYPDAILVIIGEEGSEREPLERLIRDKKLTDKVFLLGRVRDARSYLKAFDLFVHSSQSEALALAILEAGQASLPVVATQVGGIPEIIESGEHGLLVPVQSPEKLASAMESLMENPAYAAGLAAHLHVRVTSYFSTERMVSETLALYAIH